MRTTRYFDALRGRPGLAAIRDEWIEGPIRTPVNEVIRVDGRIRRWIEVPEAESRCRWVVPLPDGETVQNAFFDRRFAP